MCAISAAVAHTLLAEFTLVHTGGSHFPASARRPIVTHSDAVASDLDIDLRECRCGGDSKGSRCRNGNRKNVSTHHFLLLPHTGTTRDLESFLSSLRKGRPRLAEDKRGFRRERKAFEEKGARPVT